jgi:uncharacterized protein YndB with AHSA1/START domain
MAANTYKFVDRWHIPYPIEMVWEALSLPEHYPTWWQGVYLSARTLVDGSPDGAGRQVAVVARGWLPYRLRFTIETLNLRKPHLIEFRASGDFVTDASRWLLKSEANGTRVTLEWNPRVEKPIVKFLSPILKPIFRWNHHWTMRRGQVQLASYLSAKTVRP